MMNTEYYKKYAQLLIDVAVNLQEGEVLVINSAPWDYPFVRIVEEVAYQRGAKYVNCDYVDPAKDQNRCRYSDEKYLDYYPQWVIDYMCHYARDGVAILDLTPPIFEINNKINPLKLREVRNAFIKAKIPFNTARQTTGVTWVKTCLPTEEWAKQVYPELLESEAFEKLWQSLIPILRLDQPDPVKAWIEHKNMMKEKKDYLDKLKIKSLEFEGPGTNLKLELAKNSGWTGGCDVNKRTGQEYIPNIPTEELFAVPDKYKINGTLSATMPLNYNGSLIQGIRFEIQDGKVVNYEADSGYEALKEILETDAGSCYFGEVALVSVSSPIFQTKTIYYNTILDENAVCHMALGNALIGTVKGYSSMSDEELDAAGLNQSTIHVDFMIGSENIKVTAIDDKDNRLVLMEQGEWRI